MAQCVRVCMCVCVCVYFTVTVCSVFVTYGCLLPSLCLILLLCVTGSSDVMCVTACTQNVDNPDRVHVFISKGLSGTSVTASACSKLRDTPSIPHHSCVCWMAPPIWRGCGWTTKVGCQGNTLILQVVGQCSDVSV